MIDPEALRLSLSEAEGIAGLLAESGLSPDAVRSLHERARGWAAGLTLLLQHSRADPAAPGEAVTEILFDYFAEEVFRQAEPAMQTFLLKTALLPKMTAAMADQMTGGEGAEALLEALARRHYFTVRSEAAEPGYQYHDLFRAFLLKLGRESTSASRREHDQCRAAAILEAAGEISAAVELWQALGDWEHLGGLVSRQAEALLRQGRSRLLESWLAAYPPGLLERSPWLQFWLGQCQLTRAAVAARSTLTRAYRHFEHAGEVTGLWLAWSAITETYILAWDDFAASGDWLAEFERLRTHHPVPASGTLEARVTCGMFNLLVFARPEHPEFPDWEERVVQLLQSGASPDLYLVTLNNLLFHYIWNVGRRGKAAWALSRIRAAHAQAGHIEPVLRCARLCWEFCYQYWYEGDLERCLALGEATWCAAVEQGIGPFNSLAFSNSVYAHLSVGDTEAGRAALARFEPVLESFGPLERAHYGFLSGWEAWLSGRMPEALEVHEQALQIARRTFYQPVGFGHLALAQLRASLGERADALRHLAGMRPWIRVARSRVGAFMRALAMAQFALAWGRRARALGLLRRALALGREEGYIFFPLFKPDDIVQLCAAALDADIEVGYVQTLIRKRGLLPDPRIVASARWPWPVRLSVLGGFALEVEGRPVTFGRKTQRKPLELLRALIAAGGRDVPAGDDCRCALARYRRRYGLPKPGDNPSPPAAGAAAKKALELKDGRLSLNPCCCRVDVWSLEQHIRAARELLSSADESAAPADLVRVTRALLGAYPGPFSGRESEIWAIRARARLCAKYRNSLQRLGAAWETRGDDALARACYERIRELETEAESGC